MSILQTGGNGVQSVFQLIGTLENDITKSIAWAMNKCPVFLKQIVYEIVGVDIDPDQVRIKYQEFEKDKGITDLEITDDNLFYMIIEAKRGWILPGASQLSLYATRHDIVRSSAIHKAIVSMSECSDTYADLYLPFKRNNGISIKHLSWKRLFEIAEESIKESSNAQKIILKELMTYMGGIMTMQAKDSNWVYVVSLGASKPEDCDLTWIEIVQKHLKYFHPVGGKGWPKDPPNYIAFRYGGRLQSIHHIEDYVVTRKLHDEVPEMPDQMSDNNHYVYKLGTAIIPAKVVKTGKIFRNGRVWAMLDTLLTADSISDARDISRDR